jgi:hypothetical protein
MKVTRIGLDIAKQIFELHGVDQRDRVVLRKTLKSDRVLEYFTQLEPCTSPARVRAAKILLASTENLSCGGLSDGMDPARVQGLHNEPAMV